MARTTAKELDRLAKMMADESGMDIEVEWAYGRPRFTAARGSVELSPRLVSGQLADWGRAWLDGYRQAVSRRGQAPVNPSSRAEHEETVRHPGKFEGERPYVPYFWEAFLEGGADSDDGDVLVFNVTADDRKEFPELRGRRTVKLVETDQGFVQEVR